MKAQLFKLIAGLTLLTTSQIAFVSDASLRTEMFLIELENAQPRASSPTLTTEGAADASSESKRRGANFTRTFDQAGRITSMINKATGKYITFGYGDQNKLQTIVVTHGNESIIEKTAVYFVTSDSINAHRKRISSLSGHKSGIVEYVEFDPWAYDWSELN
jgi:hypothetical protein